MLKKFQSSSYVTNRMKGMDHLDLLEVIFEFELPVYGTWKAAPQRCVINAHSWAILLMNGQMTGQRVKHHELLELHIVPGIVNIKRGVG